MSLSYSIRAKKILDYSAAKIAKKFNNSIIEPEHLLYAILQERNCLAVKILKDLAINVESFEKRVETFLLKKKGQFVVKDTKLPFSSSSMDALAIAEEEARLMISDVIGTEHILLGIVKLKNPPIEEIFKEYNLTFGLVQDEIYSFLGVDYQESDIDSFFSEEELREMNTESKKNKNSLKNFSINLNELAKKGKLDPVIGREVEINRVIEILNRRTKNNPILIGEPGVGKTAIVEGLSQKIVDGFVPPALKKKNIYVLDIASVVAGTKYRGEFEERIKKIIQEAIKNKNIILFIDEFHTIIGAGSAEGTLDAANILKPALARGEIQIIGATTLSEYKKYIENDKALERRMQSVIVNEPDKKQTINILQGLRKKYEDYHNVVYSDDAVYSAVELSMRFIPDRFLPDKAIDLLDEAGARAHSTAISLPNFIEKYQKKIKKLEENKKKAVEKQLFEEAIVLRDKIVELKKEFEVKKREWEVSTYNKVIKVTKSDVEKVLANWLHIPVEKVTEEEGKHLLKMESFLKKRIIGQDEAIEKISNSIRRSRVGLHTSKRPIGSFIFLGPTGVGKTLLAKVIAEFLFGSEEKLLRIDMSDFMEKFSVSKLVGAPPGYVGYKEGGLLTEKVRKNPYIVILFDEIEKAHPDVFNILLQILEEGQLTDSSGNVVNFSNSLIILTSNIGTRELEKSPMGFDDIKSIRDEKKEIEHNAKKSLKKLFSPEFLNRIDDIIIFNRLSKKDILKILNMELKKLTNNLKEKNINIEITASAKKYLLDKCYDKTSGARNIRRVIQTEIENTLAEKILQNNKILKYIINFEKNKLNFLAGDREVRI